jgi:mitochondrial intermembrane space import and assembly protein 40
VSPIIIQYPPAIMDGFDRSTTNDDFYRGMQDCFRNYPEIYGSEAEEGDEDDYAEIGDEKDTATDHGIEGGAPPSAKPSSKPTVSEAAGDVQPLPKSAVSAVNKKEEKEEKTS